MKILLTGSRGFIGYYLLEKLRNEGHTVFEVDKKNGKDQDILNKDSKYFKWLGKQKIDLIINLAAIARVRDSVEDPNLAMENIQIIYNMMEFARKNKIKKFLFSSSRETYGNINIKSYKELEARHYNAESPYAMFKLIPKNKSVEIYGKDKVLDFTYIDDCVSGILQVIKNYDKLAKQEVPIFNLAYGRGEKLVDVAQYIKNKFNSKSKVNILKNHVGEVVYYKADISKINKLIGFKPKFNVYQGIDEMIDAK